MNLLTKSSIAIFSASSLGGIVVYATSLLNNENPKITIQKKQIREKLMKEGFKLINDTNALSWAGVLEKYKLATIRSFSGSQEKNKTESELKNDCDSELIKNIEEENKYRNNPIYSKVAQWCVKKEKMETILERSGFRILKFDSRDDQKEQKFLEEKVKKLKENNNQAFLALRNATGEVIKEGDEKNVETLKKGCEALDTKNLETINDNFLNSFYLAKDLCFVND